MYSICPLEIYFVKFRRTLAYDLKAIHIYLFLNKFGFLHDFVTWCVILQIKCFIL